MTDQHYSNESTEKVVTVSQDDELRLNSTVYQSHFADIEYVRLGTHHELVASQSPLEFASGVFS